MAKTDDDIHRECMQRFIDLANTMKEEGVDTRVVSAGLMTASAVYGSYVFAGNAGRIAPAGVDKLTLAYRRQLEQVQQAKAEREAAASNQR